MAARLRRAYYGWVIVAACLVITTFIYGVQYSFGVFLGSLKEDFTWTPAMISWVPGLYMLFLSVFGLVAGWLTDRYGPKIIIGIGGLFIGLGLVLTSQLNASWQIFIYYSFMVGGGTGSAGPPVFATVTRWFVERRGLALGIVTAGIGLGIVIMSPVAGWLNSTYDWQTSYRIIGFAALIIVPAALLLKKQPVEASPQGTRDDQTGHDPSLGLQGLTLAQTLRTSNLWLLIALYILAFAGLLMVMFHLVAYAEDMDILDVTAASFLSVIGGASIIARIAGGIASDKWGWKPVFITSLLLQAIVMLWLRNETSVWAFYLFAAIWGFGYGGWAPLMPAITAELFGLRHMGSVLGLVAVSFGMGGLLGSAIAGHTYTELDSYAMAFLIGAGMMTLAATAVPFLKIPAAFDGS